MGKEIDYAEVIDANNYIIGLLEHPDIPQSDTGIMRLIKEYKACKLNVNIKVLDLGCGPGRLTKRVADEVFGVSVTGLDVSRGFIESAKKSFFHEHVQYIEQDFLDYEPDGMFDVIFMQGSFHHIEIEKREQWVQKIKDMLTPEGLIIIGDEYIPDYKDENERIIKVAGLYSYVIAYAMRNGHTSLATIECMNLIDDACYGRVGAGHSSDMLLSDIKKRAILINECVYSNGVKDNIYKNQISELVQYINIESEKLVDKTKNNNRGDYKISVEKQIEIFEMHGFKLGSVLKYGPTDWIGGMGVISFIKK